MKVSRLLLKPTFKCKSRFQDQAVRFSNFLSVNQSLAKASIQRFLLYSQICFLIVITKELAKTPNFISVYSARVPTCLRGIHATSHVCCCFHRQNIINDWPCHLVNRSSFVHGLNFINCWWYYSVQYCKFCLFNNSNFLQSFLPWLYLVEVQYLYDIKPRFTYM